MAALHGHGQGDNPAVHLCLRFLLGREQSCKRGSLEVLAGAECAAAACSGGAPRLRAGYFLTKIFHPNVAKGGEICVNVLKRDWARDLGLRHVLLVVRCLLVEPFPESALNEEAGKLLLEGYEEYARHAALMTSIHAQPAKRCVLLGLFFSGDCSASLQPQPSWVVGWLWWLTPPRH